MKQDKSKTFECPLVNPVTSWVKIDSILNETEEAAEKPLHICRTSLNISFYFRSRGLCFIQPMARVAVYYAAAAPGRIEKPHCSEITCVCVCVCAASNQRAIFPSPFLLSPSLCLSLSFFLFLQLSLAFFPRRCIVLLFSSPATTSTTTTLYYHCVFHGCHFRFGRPL